jgi:uncharacterized protein
MTILLTGGTGLLGNALGQELVKAGHKINVLTRDPSRARRKLSYPCKLFEWDGESEDVPPSACEGVGVLIHLAGENIAEKRWTAARKAQLRSSRINSAHALAKAFANRPLELVVGASGIGYYGDRGDEWLTEESSAGGDFLARLCVEWETSVRLIPARRTISLRLGVILSAGGGFLRQVVPLFLQLGASRLGDGRQFLSWIHIDDAVRLIMECMGNSKLEGAVNACAPEPITNRDWTAIIARRVGALPGPPVPSFALRVLYGQLSIALLGSQSASPRKALDAGFGFKHEKFQSAIDQIFEGAKPGEMVVQFEQWLPVPRAEVWPFFSSEENLERITPQFLQFKVLGKSTEQLQAGSLIDYKLKLKGLPLKWRTRIEEWQPGHEFVDTQLKGPYRTWHHRHRFSDLGGGTLAQDRIRLMLPLGLLGRTLALTFVLSDVDKIFAYRSKVLNEIFAHGD